MVTVRYGGKKGKRHTLVESDRLVAVRTQSRIPLLDDRPFQSAAISDAARTILDDFTLVARFGDAGVDVLRSRVQNKVREIRDKARATLKQEPGISFAGRVLCDSKSKAPVLYTENLFVKFDDDQKTSACKKLLKSYELTIKRELEYARNAYFVAAAENTGQDIFALAEKLLAEAAVELCHPELVRQLRNRDAFTPQWHLKKTTISGATVDAHASVEAAWALSEGEGVIVAVIDDGVDIDHEEFRSSGKTVAPQNVSLPANHPSRNNPRPGSGDNHGTACAGVACADGRFGASGVAPRARLMPIRLVSGLGSQAEADAFIHAASNGADVISCSWGPQDGRWWDPGDPVHNVVVPLPDSTRLAIDWAISNGRNGKGCVICWAAGNGNESVDNDGYASYDKVIAVTACNDGSKRSAYSDFGRAAWCAFPSNDGNPSLTSGIWTTDRSGALGYNPGSTARGDIQGNYTNSFGGTSSACPGGAGVAALILARNPNLRWDEVKNLIRHSCDRIDEAGGNYDADGHSPFYGYGRVNAKRAVELAAPPQADHVVINTVLQDVAIKDLQTSTLAVNVADDGPLKDIRVTVDIEHTYIGDLIVSIKPPAATGVGTVRLHNREGRGTQNIKKAYDTVNAPGLAALLGKSPQGSWTLVVEDKARQDVGRIRSAAVELRF